MLALRLIQRKIPTLPYECRKRLFCSKKNNKKTDMFRMDGMTSAENIIMVTLCGCGMIGGGFGIHKGYRLHKHDSYEECARQTTLYCFKGAALGVIMGGFACLISPLMIPLIIPVFCISIPVAGGSVIVKYYEESTKTP